MLHPKTAAYTFFSHVHKQSPVQITCQATKQVSVNLGRFKSYQASFPTQWYETRYQLQAENWKKHKHVDTKQYATKQSVNEDIKEEIRKYLETKKMETQLSKIYGTQQKQF